MTLHVIAGILIFVCAIAIAIAPMAPELWRPLGITGAAVGIVGFLIFWDGQTRFLVDEGLLGASTSLAILISTIVFSGAFN